MRRRDMDRDWEVGGENEVGKEEDKTKYSQLRFIQITCSSFYSWSSSSAFICHYTFLSSYLFTKSHNVIYIYIIIDACSYRKQVIFIIYIHLNIKHVYLFLSVSFFSYLLVVSSFLPFIHLSYISFFLSIFISASSSKPTSPLEGPVSVRIRSHACWAFIRRTGLAPHSVLIANSSRN